MSLTAYLTAAEARDLAARIPGLSLVVPAADELLDAALEEATLRVDGASRWQGRRYAAGQELEFPRVPRPGVGCGMGGCRDDEWGDDAGSALGAGIWDWDATAGGGVGAAVVPEKVLRAVVIEAEEILGGDKRLKRLDGRDGLASQSNATVSESYVAGGGGGGGGVGGGEEGWGRLTARSRGLLDAYRLRTGTYL